MTDRTANDLVRQGVRQETITGGASGIGVLIARAKAACDAKHQQRSEQPTGVDRHFPAPHVDTTTYDEDVFERVLI